MTDFTFLKELAEMWDSTGKHFAEDSQFNSIFTLCARQLQERIELLEKKEAIVYQENTKNLEDYIEASNMEPGEK